MPIGGKDPPGIAWRAFSYQLSAASLNLLDASRSINKSSIAMISRLRRLFPLYYENPSLL